MKLSLPLLLLAIVAGIACAKRDLNDDYNDFLKIISLNRIKETIHDYVKKDMEPQVVAKFMQGPIFKERFDKILFDPEVQSFLDHLRKGGLDVDGILGEYWDWIKHLPTNGPATGTRTFRNMLDDIKKYVPMDKILAEFSLKLVLSDSFKKFHQKLRSGDTYRLCEKLLAHPDIEWVVEKLEKMKIRVWDAFRAIYTFFGWIWTRYDKNVLGLSKMFGTRNGIKP